MSERLKRILLIVGFVLVVVAMAFSLYWFFFRAQPETPPGVTPGITTPPGELPGAGTAGPVTPGETQGVPGLPTPDITGVVPSLPTGVPETTRTNIAIDTPTTNIAMSKSGDVRGYNQLDGKFYRFGIDGTATPLSNQVFFQVEDVSWARNSDKAVLTYPDGTNIYYDFASDKQVTLPKHWQDFSFSPQDDKIVTKSVGNNEDNRFLVVANPDGTNAKPVEPLGSNQDKVHVDWSPNNQVIAYSFTGEPLGFDRQQILLLGQNRENFKGLIVEGRGFIPEWSPSGKNMLYSVYSSDNGYIPSIWISGAQGDSVNANRRNLQLNTWADKCAWQGETIVICGVPTKLSRGAGLQRTLFENVPDEIYKIDLAAGTKTNLGFAAGNASVNEITVTPDGNTALLTDVATGRLIRFDLK
jgi:Tol biopolymer transport system component